MKASARCSRPLLMRCLPRRRAPRVRVPLVPPPCRGPDAADVLVLLKLKINVPQNQQCCPLLGNLVNLDLAACLCAAIRLSVIGIPVNLPLDVPLVLNYCGRNASAVPGSNCSF